MKYCIHCMLPLPEGAERCPACEKSQEITVPEHHLKPGTVLNGKYCIGAAIGEGGFGITYIGRDTMLDMRVAVKEYYPNGYASRTADATVQPAVSEERKAFYHKGMERFLQEARTLAKFSGEPGIVDVRDFFEANQTAYIVMAYLDGETLRQYLKRSGPMTAEDAVHLLQPVMCSLQKIHEKGLVHRDISPDNIMLVDRKAKLIDFGAARYVMGDSTRSLSVMLKPGYAPEEQYRTRGEQGPWTDVYALCATLYRCITGKVVDEAAERLHEDTVKRPSELGAVISPACETALMKGMAVRSKDRYQSVEALLAGLQGKDADPDDERTVYRSQSAPAPAPQQPAPSYTPQQPAPPSYTPQQPAPPSYTPQQPAPSYTPQQPAPPSYTPQQPAPAESPKKQKKKKNPLLIAGIIGGAAVAVLVLCIVIKYSSTVKFTLRNYDGSTEVKEVSISEESLSFRNQEITVDFLRSIAKMKNLKYLYFDNCTFSESAEGGLKLLPVSLRNIEINQCSFTNEKLACIPFGRLDNLVSIDLSDNPELSDLSPLEPAMQNLNTVAVSRTAVQDFSVLDTSKTIFKLSANDCPNADFTTLHASALSMLLASDNELTDISFLSAMPNISKLSLSNNQLTDLSPLSDLPMLSTLDLSQNKISDLTPLAGCSYMSILKIQSNQVSDVAPLAGMEKLYKLYASDNALETLSPLTNVKELNYLDVTRNQLKDLKGLESAIALKNLFAGENALESLDGLENSTILETVNLSNNQLKNLGQIGKSADNLKLMNLSDNALTNLNELKDCTTLKALLADNNQIESLSPLQSCAELSAISLENNALTDLAGLEDKQKLVCIYLPGNRISDASALQTVNTVSKQEMKILNLADNELNSLDVNPEIKYSLLILYGNKMQDNEVIRHLTGSEVQFSYTEGMDINGLTDGYFYCKIIDAPLDQQVSLKEGSDRSYTIEFLSKEEADTNNKATKDALLGNQSAEPPSDTVAE